jgi:glycerol-3-phosphate dehydrogenase (NAD(P)+)
MHTPGLENRMKIGILGAGTWGIALTALLAKNGHDLTVWSAIENEIKELKETARHKNLPGLVLVGDIKYTADIKEAVNDRQLIIFVTPSEYIRATAKAAAPHIANGAILASAAKGIEKSTLMTMTDIIGDEMSKIGRSDFSLVALSGPTHAEEVALGLPTSIVAACEDEKIALSLAEAFSNSCMRVYINTDLLGVELSGALKNIMALAAGINTGMGFGDNAKAMLITRGAAEMTRIGLAMGARLETFMGLAGIGDLIVTCTSVHSRNNRCGELIGMGKTYAEAAKEIGMVVEGYHALGAAVELSKKYSVEMPIVTAVNAIINEGLSPVTAIRSLMNREVKNELDLTSYKS